MEDSSSESFGFAFNDSDFSDRVLHIEITTADESLPPKLKKNLFTNSPPQTHKSVSKKRRKNTHNSVSDSSAAGVQLKSLHLNSAILAAKSLFFFKLFKNGMTESQQKEATLRIYSTEEASLMDLLKFMYTNTLSATTCSDLVDVLMAADKFEVNDCVKHCIRLLLEMPMTLESALLYLEVPSTVLTTEPDLLDALKQYLVARFKDLGKCEEEAMKLPLAAIEIVLGSMDLQVAFEEIVYNFVLKWAREHYPNLEERREILTNRMMKLICFPFMSCSNLKNVLASDEFHHEKVSKLVMEALFIQAQVPYGQPIHTTKRRLYTHRLVKVVHVEFPLPRCVVFFDLTREECRALPPSEWIYSQLFTVGGRESCIGAQKSSSLQFGLYLFTTQRVTKTCTVNYELAVMKKPSNKFEIQRKDNGIVIAPGKGMGYPDLFVISWSDFISDDSVYFIDGILHLRADVTFTNS